MTDAPSQADQATCARDAIATIEAVLDRQCPEMKSAFWTAVDKLYRLDVSPAAGRTEVRSRPSLEGQRSAQGPQETP